jgi:hypothetical protein
MNASRLLELDLISNLAKLPVVACISLPLPGIMIEVPEYTPPCKFSKLDGKIVGVFVTLFQLTELAVTAFPLIEIPHVPDAPVPVKEGTPISVKFQATLALPLKALPVFPTVIVLAVCKVVAVDAFPVVFWLRIGTLSIARTPDVIVSAP